MKRLIAAICLPFIIIACSSMGTTLLSIDKDELYSLKRIGIVPCVFYNLPDDISRDEFRNIIEICDSTMISNMKKQSQIKDIFMIYNDTLYTKYFEDIDGSKLNEYVKLRNLDALIFITITYRKTSVMFIPAVFSKTNMTVKKGDNLNTIYELEYDNRFTSDASTYEHSTEEGIEGVVNLFIDKLKK